MVPAHEWLRMHAHGYSTLLQAMLKSAREGSLSQHVLQVDLIEAPQEWKDLALRCICVNPRDRPTAAEVSTHINAMLGDLANSAPCA